jgi:hypothetical protein
LVFEKGHPLLVLIKLGHELPLEGGLFSQQHSELCDNRRLQYIQVDILSFFFVQVHFQQVNNLLKFHQLIAYVEDLYVFLNDHLVGDL